MPETFEGTSYYLSAFFDVVDSREEFRYTPHNLGVVLDTLHPRPKALVIGAAIHPSLVDGMKETWKSYVENVLQNEFKDDWRENCIVSVNSAPNTSGAFLRFPNTLQMPDWCYIDPSTVTGPPKDRGLQETTLQQLDAVFDPDKGKS